MTATQPQADGNARQKLAGWRLRALFTGLLLAMLLAALDGTIVATALPTIVTELGGVERLSWIVTAYLLAQTIVIPIYGKLGDLYGRKIVLQSAIVIFLAGSVLCGFSRTLFELIVFRLIQGLGGGGLIVTSQAVIGDVVSPRERGRYQGILGGAFALASVAGPLLGGFFTTHLSWSWIFFINLPLGLLAFGVIAATLPKQLRRVRRQVDYAGAGLLAVALGGFVLTTDLGGLAYPWLSAPIAGLAAVALTGVIAFTRVEHRAAEPILPPRLFSDATFVVVTVVGFTMGFALFGSVTYLPAFLQVVKGASPTDSGLQMIPMMAGSVVASVLAGQAVTRWGRYRAFPIAGTALATVSLVLLTTISPETNLGTLLLYLALLGTGLGLVTQVLIVAVQNAARYEDLGVATSGVTLFRLIGGSVGTAVLGSIFAAGVAGSDAATPEYASVFTTSLRSIFMTAAIVSAVGAVAAWRLPERPLRETVAAATANVGEDAGETFPLPLPDDAQSELLRGLSILANRDVHRAHIQAIVRDAQLPLLPAAAWLLLRINDDPSLDIEELARRNGLSIERLRAGLDQLHERGDVVTESRDGRPHHVITPEGASTYDRLAAARRARLIKLQEEWPPEQRQQLADVLHRLADDLVPPRAHSRGAEL